MHVSDWFAYPFASSIYNPSTNSLHSEDEGEFCSDSGCVSVAKHRVQGLPVCARHYVSQSGRKGRIKSARRQREMAIGTLHDVVPDNPIVGDWLG